MDKDHNCMKMCIGSVRTPMSGLLWRPSQCFCNHSKQMQNILPLQIEFYCWVLKQTTLSGSLAQGMKLLRLAKGAVRNSQGRVLLCPGTRPPTSPRRSGEKIGFILGGFHIKHPDFSWLPSTSVRTSYVGAPSGGIVLVLDYFILRCKKAV